MTEKEEKDLAIKTITNMLRSTPFTVEFKVVKNPKGIRIIHEVTQEELDAAIKIVAGKEE